MGGESTGLGLVSLEDVHEGRPLMKLLKQQKLTIPSVRVYADAENAKEIRREFNQLFPTGEEASELQDEFDMTEA